MNNGNNVNNPTKAADAVSFLMNLGYAIAGNGWDMQVTAEEREREHQLGINVPIVKNPDGSSITGPSYDTSISTMPRRALRAGVSDGDAGQVQGDAHLRARLDDKPATIPASDWKYVNENAIRLLPAGTLFKQSHVYEFMYTGERSGRRRARSRGHARFRVFPEERGRRRFRDPEPAGRQHPEDVFRHLFSRRATSTTSRPLASTRTRAAGRSSTAC
jgi:hypothetical protein